MTHATGEHASSPGGPRAAAPSPGVPALVLPDRRVFWTWVWSAVRPVLGWVLAALGAIALFIGWYGVSGQALTAKQMPYLVSGGLTGIALILMGGVFLATEDVRHSLARLGEVERKVDELYALFAADIAAQPSSATAPTDCARPALEGSRSAIEAVALPTGTSYHRPDCALVAGKTGVGPVTADDVARRGLRACRVCDPDPLG
jgi:hypothetical protein